MLHSARVPNFKPSTHGLPWPNSYPVGTRVFLFNTPFGAIGVPDASRGLCGGMIFTVMDLYEHGMTSIPQSPSKPVFNYICHRLFTSWGLPFAWLKYWDWQRRPNQPKRLGGAIPQRGLTDLMLMNEWPKIRARLDAGQLAPLGLIHARSLSPLKLGQNHQVVSYGYDFDDVTGDVTLQIYDPNYPGDDAATLRFNMQNDGIECAAVTHSREGKNVRAIFLTDYRPTVEPPNFPLPDAVPPRPQ